MIGANDVTELTKPSVAVPFLEDAVRRLRARGAEVVVGTCPDLGTIRPIAQPLRAYARRLSRKMAPRADRRRGRGRRPDGVARRPARPDVRHAPRAVLAPTGSTRPRRATRRPRCAVLPSALDALGLGTRARSASPFTTRRSKPLAKAAAQAAARPGSEVAAEPRRGR